MLPGAPLFFFGCPLYRTYNTHARTRSQPAFRKLTKLTLPPDCLLFVARQSQSVSIILHRIPPFAPHLPSRPRTLYSHSFTLYLTFPRSTGHCLTPSPPMGSAASRPRQIIPKSLSHPPSGTSPFFLARVCLNPNPQIHVFDFPIQFSQLITFFHISIQNSLLKTTTNDDDPWIWR